MIYKVANIFGCHYDDRVNKYVLGVLLAHDGKWKDTRLFFNTKEEAEKIEIGQLIEYTDERDKKTKSKSAGARR